MSGGRRRRGLIAARKRAGLSQEQAAEKLGVALSTWQRWERGELDARPRHRAGIAVLLGVTAAQVERWLDNAEPDSHRWVSAEAGYVSMAATLGSASELWRWDVDPTRRRLLTVVPFVPASLSEWLLSWIVDPGGESRARAGSGSLVRPEDVNRVLQATQGFDEMDRRFGGGHTRPAVVEYLNSQVTPLLNGTYTDAVGRQLMSAAALMTTLAGWEAYDIGLQGLAQMHYGQALQLAKAGDDDLTAARVLSALAQQAIDLKQSRWAIRLASVAREAAARADACPRVRAMLVLREATATALGVSLADTNELHGAGRVRRLIAEAETAFARVGPADREPTWISYFTLAEFVACAGCCWQMIGDHQRALACAEQAVHELGARFSRAVQFNMVHAATARLGLGDLDAAIASAQEAVPMANALTSNRSIKLVKDFDAKLNDRVNDRRVAHWRDYLRTELRAAS